jgi:hypothetical protein
MHSDFMNAMDEFETMCPVTSEQGNDYLVAVSKVGGGTVGDLYSGRWYVSVMDITGRRLNSYNSNGELDTVHKRMTHGQAARESVKFWEFYHG